MTLQFPKELGAAARRAIDRALDFLAAEVKPSGAWPSLMYPDLVLTGSPKVEYVPFVAAVALLALEVCNDARVDAIRGRTRRFLFRRMEYPGVWRYWAGLPPDLDDSALCSLAAGAHPWLLVGRNVDRLLAHRDRDGRFRTWMPKPGDSSRNDVDSVVNANVLAYLGERPETRGAARWLEMLIEEDCAAGTSHYYPDPLDLYVALVRAGGPSAPGLERLRPVLAERIMAHRRTDGGFGDTLRTAQAASALAAIGAAEASVLESAVAHVVEAQRPDGGWTSPLVWQGPRPPCPPSIGFASDGLTAACCIEALERLTETGRRPVA